MDPIPGWGTAPNGEFVPEQEKLPVRNPAPFNVTIPKQPGTLCVLIRGCDWPWLVLFAYKCPGITQGSWYLLFFLYCISKSYLSNMKLFHFFWIEAPSVGKSIPIFLVFSAHKGTTEENCMIWVFLRPSMTPLQSLGVCLFVCYLEFLKCIFASSTCQYCLISLPYNGKEFSETHTYMHIIHTCTLTYMHAHVPPKRK